jgi:hypothetical protein
MDNNSFQNTGVAEYFDVKKSNRRISRLHNEDIICTLVKMLQDRNNVIAVNGFLFQNAVLRRILGSMKEVTEG